MSLTDRDRKIVMVLVPLLVVLGYWFLLLSPKRDAAAKAGEALAQQEQKRDDALAKANQAQAAKGQFATKYASLVRLGKAVPTSLDMPTLMVQLDAAARGTGIRFSKIATGDEEGGAGGGGASTPPPAGGSGGGGSGGGGSTPAQGAGAQGGKGGDASSQAGGNAAPKDQAGSGAGAQPQSGGTAGAAGGAQPGGASGACAPGLECVPLQFEFSGGFFDLADFFHRLKRFVRVANDRIAVQGRLMTVDQFKFSSGEESFPSLKAEVTATIYLAPKAEGATAGATPSGPNTPAGGAAKPAATPPAPPTATATP